MAVACGGVEVRGGGNDLCSSADRVKEMAQGYADSSIVWRGWD